VCLQEPGTDHDLQVEAETAWAVGLNAVSLIDTEEGLLPLGSNEAAYAQVRAALSLPSVACVFCSILQNYPYCQHISCHRGGAESPGWAILMKRAAVVLTQSGLNQYSGFPMDHISFHHRVVMCTQWSYQ
jgi:hypothetical protein